jgi:hypothetical protein
MNAPWFPMPGFERSRVLSCLAWLGDGERSSELASSCGNRGKVAMALSNFLLTVAAVGAGFVLLKGDVRRSAVTLRRNLKQVRTWLEQEQASSGSTASK